MTSIRLVREREPIERFQIGCDICGEHKVELTVVYYNGNDKFMLCTDCLTGIRTTTIEELDEVATNP